MLRSGLWTSPARAVATSASSIAAMQSGYVSSSSTSAWLRISVFVIALTLPLLNDVELHLIERRARKGERQVERKARAAGDLVAVPARAAFARRRLQRPRRAAR